MILEPTYADLYRALSSNFSDSNDCVRAIEPFHSREIVAVIAQVTRQLAEEEDDGRR